jgi:hypothetical protein
MNSRIDHLISLRLTSSQTRPPKLWQTNIIGRLFYRYELEYLTATESDDTHSIIILPVCCDRGQQVHRMVPNPILRDHALPVCNICIVSECKNASVGDLGW